MNAKTVAGEISEEMGTRNAVVAHRTETGCAAVRSFLLRSIREGSFQSGDTKTATSKSALNVVILPKNDLYVWTN